MRMPFAVSRMRPPCASAVMPCPPPIEHANIRSRRCGYCGSVIHDLRKQPTAPDHRLDRYAPVIVLVPNAGLTCGYVAVTMRVMKYAASESALHIELSIDEGHALKSAAVRLRTEFADAFDVETVERMVCSSYEKLAAHATVRDFLPLLAERFARQQLHAIAKINGKSHDYQLVVSFLCNHNAGRSQMAMGFFKQLAGGGAVGGSGGSEPKGEINPAPPPPWASAVSISPANTPNRGPVRSSKPPT